MTPALRSSSEPPSFTVLWSSASPSHRCIVAALFAVAVSSSESSDVVVPEPSTESVASLAVTSTESTLAGLRRQKRGAERSEEATDGEGGRTPLQRSLSPPSDHWSVIKGAGGPDRKL